MFWLLRLPAMWKSLPNKFSKLWSWKILKRDGDCKPRQMMKLKGYSAVSHFPQNRFECLRMQFLDLNYHVRLTCPILVPRSRLCHLLKGHSTTICAVIQNTSFKFQILQCSAQEEKSLIFS
uniref:Uncharacterized protein n=1 Tax=Opuntia streptacantha TaxID=393608 RepID=A0A7C9ALC1_OPUST